LPLLLRNPAESGHRIRSMSTTESGACRPHNPMDAVHFGEQIGIRGRHGSESVDGIRRNQ
jgi:hypothetical protein